MRLGSEKKTWVAVGLAVVALLMVWKMAGFGWIEGGVWARKSTAGKWVELKLTPDADGVIKVVIGTNEITFPVRKGRELQTGRLRNSGDVVRVFRNGQLICQIPVAVIPEGKFEKFCYDNAAPLVRTTESPGPNSYGWNNSAVTITVTAEDEVGGSGISAILYQIGTGSQVKIAKDKLALSEGGRVATYTLRLTDDNTYQIGFWAVDEAGNEGKPQSVTVRIDSTKPAVSLSPSGGRYRSSVSISWSATDGLSGIASVGLYVGGSRVSTSASGSYTLSPGNHTVEVRAEDKAGNTASTSLSYTVYQPSFFQVTEVTASPSVLQVGQSSTIRARIRNTGEEAGTRTVTLYIDDTSAGTRSLTLNAGASDTVSFSYTFNSVGTFTAKVGTGDDSRSTTVRVEAKPPYFQVSGLSVSPSSPRVDQQVTITATIRNTGGSRGSQSVQLMISGSVKDFTSVTLDPGQSTTIRFYYTFRSAGTYEVKVRSEDDYDYRTVLVTKPSTPPDLHAAWPGTNFLSCIATSSGGTSCDVPVVINFIDEDGDIVRLSAQVSHSSGASLGTVTVDPGVRGQTHGLVTVTIPVRTSRGQFCTGYFVLRLTLQDAAGNVSRTVSVSIAIQGCVGGW